MAAKFKIDGSSLTRNNFADVLIDEVIYNKVLHYPDSNRKLKVIEGKVSTKNIIPDMGHGRPIDFSHIRTYSLMCQMLRTIFIALVIEFQDNIADMVRYVFFTRQGLKYLSLYYNKLKQIKMRL